MIGASLDQYRITATIGAGGMGEVFRARDTRLHRDVAVKVLPKDFVADADRLRRFEQEAKTLAALNHPNVLTIHDAGVHEGAPYLVSELLEGETLREEMNGGALPVRKATEFALQIAHGLAAAHGKGVIHRDLKPENIFVTKDGRVKILDFGLAKLKAPVAADVTRLTSKSGEKLEPPHVGCYEGEGGTIRINPDAIINTTEPGMVLGTPAYMSPEQVRGEPADHRADIFAFGCVLYEMLSGTRAFRRDTPVESMNAVLSEEPPELSATNPNIPLPLERVVRRCLEKKPDNRFQSAKDLAFAITNVGAASSVAAGIHSQKPGWARLIPWATAAALAITLGMIFPSLHRAKIQSGAGTDSAGPLNKFQILLPVPDMIVPSPTDKVAISPDGRKLAYANLERGLWLQRLDQVASPILLVSGMGIHSPFWSPTSDDIGYFQADNLYRASLDGSRPVLLCTAGESQLHGTGAAWLTNGRITFAGGSTNLLEVSAQGGGSPGVALATQSGERDFHQPSALPAGRGILFVLHRLAERADEGMDTIALLTPSGKRKNLLHIPHSKLRAPVFSSGHILFGRSDSGFQGIWACPLSIEKLECAGEPFRIADSASHPSVSNGGTLAFATGENPYFAPRQLVWVDRSGRVLEPLGKPLPGLGQQRVSPDGRKVLAVAGESFAASRIWLFDVASGTAFLWSSGAGKDDSPAWATNGQFVFYSRIREPGASTLLRASDGEGAERLVLEKRAMLQRSGHHLFLARPNAYVRLADPEKRVVFFPEPFQWTFATLSPDDRLLAYFDPWDENQNEIYAVEFPGFRNRRVVSRGGGERPVWHPNGQELFFTAKTGRTMMAARLKPGTLEFEAPVKLFDFPPSIYDNLSILAYDVAPDGNFLMLQKVEATSNDAATGRPRAQIVLNWFEEFRQKK